MLLTPPQEPIELAINSFNGHPPLGVNATGSGGFALRRDSAVRFQWAPTLGGECYCKSLLGRVELPVRRGFNGHPPLGVNATSCHCQSTAQRCDSFNGHPPLGVNATSAVVLNPATAHGFNGHPPLGVNATGIGSPTQGAVSVVSMGTHPWG